MLAQFSTLPNSIPEFEGSAITHTKDLLPERPNASAIAKMVASSPEALRELTPTVIRQRSAQHFESPSFLEVTTEYIDGSESELEASDKENDIPELDESLEKTAHMSRTTAAAAAAAKPVRMSAVLQELAVEPSFHDEDDDDIAYEYDDDEDISDHDTDNGYSPSAITTLSFATSFNRDGRNAPPLEFRKRSQRYDDSVVKEIVVHGKVSNCRAMSILGGALTNVVRLALRQSWQ